MVLFSHPQCGIWAEGAEIDSTLRSLLLSIAHCCPACSGRSLPDDDVLLALALLDQHTESCLHWRLEEWCEDRILLLVAFDPEEESR